ncbi:MAG: tRNA 2-selenouridine(34) synthase MnmH [Campylobacter sp.]|nr:tRNA 2-selenouridine(34) synthase MnmH [Campylobacter sp.]
MPLNDIEIDEWLKERDKFEILIDARSPQEFAYSHIRNSKNLYALNDEQHKEIGTIYKQNKAEAKALGAKYICGNLQNVIDEVYSVCKVGSMIGIYCAKGGLRSNSIGLVLSMIGYRVRRLDGGYKSFRNYVQRELSKPMQTKFITLFGNTGSYKTKLIKALKPSLDLEGMANHLGSVFGAINGEQPSQKFFEDELFENLSMLKNEVCFIEGESRRIGSLTLPASIYEAMRAGVCIEIVASLNRRVECIMSDYKNISREFFYECMGKISPFISHEAKEDAIRAYELGDIAKVSEILLVKYYDKVYKKNQKIDVTISSDNFAEALAKLNDIRDKIINSRN